MSENEILSNNDSIFKKDDEMNKNILVGGYDEELVINKNYLESLDNIYKCSICNKIMLNPVECEECGHNYCNDCINSSDCPFGCKTKIIKPASLAIKNLLSKLRFKCPNVGCTIRYDYSKIEKHNNECLFQKVKCPNKNCDKIMLRKDLSNHFINECEFLLIKCRYCYYEFKKKEIEEHENICKLLNREKDSLNYDNSKIGFDEHLKRLSKNIKEIIKNNQKLIENSENNDKNLDDYPRRTSIRKSIVPGLEGDEFLDVIQKEIETKVKNYHEEFNNNYNKIINEIDDIKELLKHHINNITLENSFNENNNNNNVNEEKDNKNKENKENEEEIKKCMNDLIYKTKDDIKNLINNYNKKFNDVFSSINNIFEEKKDIISDDINKDNNQKQNKDMYSIINNIVNNLNKYINETNEQIKNLTDAFYNNINNYINKKNNERELDINEIGKNINDIIESNENENLKKLEEKIKNIKLDAENENNENSKPINSELNIDTNNQINEVNNKNDINISNKIISLNNTFGELNNELTNIKNNIKQTINLINEKFSDFSDLINKKEKNETKEIQKEIKDIIRPIEICSISSFSLLKKEKQDNNQLLLNVKENDNNIRDSFHSAEFLYNANGDNVSNSLMLIKNMNNRMTLLENNSKDFISKIKERVNSELSNKLNEINSKIENDIDEKIEKMFSLKYCKECEKVDYFYGFINCSICSVDNCKQCVVVCINCKNFFCLNCCFCKKCERNICENCRFLCISCNTKYCQFCMLKCPSCNQKVCSNCLNQCISCGKNNCEYNCSKTCNVCFKNYCNNCFKNYKFSKCDVCNNNICNDCVNICKEHKKNICKTCSNKCFNCGNLFCNKYLIDCNQCKAKYCKDCGNTFEENNKCELCKKVCCNYCTNKNGNPKCITCQKKICLECSSKCINCSNNHCKMCSKKCQNCKNSICIKCYSECACGKEKYCNKCMLKNEPILPHECIYFINKNAITESKKTRSFKQIPYNVNIEAKFSVFMNDMSDKSFLLIGLTDNNSFEENCNDEVKNIFAVNANNGDKFSTDKGFEAFLDFENIKEGFNNVYVMVEKHKLFFKINNSIYKWAYELKKKTNYWFYIETNIDKSTSKFVFVRKIS